MRKIVRLILYPFVYIVAWSYKKYSQYFRKKHREIKYKNIVDGFSYLIVPDTEVEKVAKKRAEICARCPHAKFITGTPKTIMVNDKTITFKAMQCGVCGCALAAKVRSMDDFCPIRLWPSEQDTQS